MILTIIPYIYRIVQFKKHLNRNRSSYSFERNKMTIYSLYEIMCDKKAKCGNMGITHNNKSLERTAVSLYWVLPLFKRVWNHACIDRQFKDVCYQVSTYQQNLVEAQTNEFKTAQLKILDNLGMRIMINWKYALTVHFVANACNLWSSENYPFLLECKPVILDNFPVYSYKKL